jgi:hypothetical protein
MAEGHFNLHRGAALPSQTSVTMYVRINITFRNVRVRMVAGRRLISITYSECVFVALVPPHTKRIFRIILLYAACSAVPDFPHSFIKDKIFRKKCNWTQNAIFSFPKKFVWKISQSKNNSARYFTNVQMSSCKVSFYSCQIVMKLEFSRHIFEKYATTEFN